MNRFITFVVIIFSLSCSNNSKNIIKRNFSHSISDTTDKDYVILRELEKILKMDGIEEGYNSFQLRVWTSYYHDTISKALVIKKDQKGAGRVEEYVFRTGFSNSPGKTDITDLTRRSLFPKSKWSTFLSQLKEFNLENLTDYTSLAGYGGLAHGDMTIVEFAGNDFYSAARSPLPCLFKNEVAEAAIVCNLLMFLEAELLIKLQ
jgi:hypothetical protein